MTSGVSSPGAIAGAQILASGYDAVIVGGGIVGTATALKILERQPRLRVLLIEKEPEVGLHQSGRNSGVIHSGVYYRPGSEKARSCVEGASLMIRFCEDHGIPIARRGKAIVAVETRELPALEDLFRRGTANGVAGLALVGPDRLAEVEPHARGIRALLVPGAAVTDFGAVTRKLAGLIVEAGGQVVTGVGVRRVARRGGAITVETTAGEVSAACVVNCAGLHSDRLARTDGAARSVRIVPFRGEYLTVGGPSADLVRSLVYPVPDPDLPFLGAHLTRGVHGKVEAGPNAVLAFSREGYRKRDISPRDLAGTIVFPGFWRMAAAHWASGLAEFRRSFSRRLFLASVRRLVPGVRGEDLAPGGSGVRAQAVDRSGALIDDFRIDREGAVVHVLNVPSPAATASLVIGRRIADLAIAVRAEAGARGR